MGPNETNSHMWIDIIYLVYRKKDLESDVDLDNDCWKDHVNMFVDIATTHC